MRRIGVSLSVTVLLGVPYLGLNGCVGSSEIKYVDAGAGGEDDGSGGTGGTGGSGTSGKGGNPSGGSTGKGGTTGQGGSAGKGSSGDGGDDTGGTSGSGGEGGVVDPGCLETGCPVGKYCDGDTRTCEDLKAAGEECEQTQQCEDPLDCRDGVCCEERECPACQNCGSDGTCSITVTSEVDSTGNECEGANSCDADGNCKSVLGESCGDGDQCVSGNCVDSLCCQESECGECVNCGPDGTCSVAVQNEDDVSSMCNGQTTCGNDGSCVERWRLVGSTLTNYAFRTNFVATVGSGIYFGNESNGDGAQYHKVFDVGTGVFSDTPITDEYCYCGYGGTAVSDDTRIYYFANDGVSYTPGASAWSTISTYRSSQFYDGEAATAYVSGRIYRVSGRTYDDRVAYYDVMTGTYVTTGLTPHPIVGATDGACAGAAGGKLYVFGWGPVVSEYDTQRNTWTTTAEDPNAPESCYEENVPLWGEYLAYAYRYGGTIKLFNVTTRLWEEGGIPLPAGLEQNKAVVVGTNLYVIGFRESDRQVVIYRYML
ncbi:MAG TPA: hypothetical protein VGK73_31280 [Polyangiaceae bacterium]